MALTVATNTGALMAQAAASSVNKEMEMSMERLSTGKRINSASDDAAGIAIASRLTSEIRGTNQAIRNAMDAQSLIDTAEGAHAEVENILQRMRELAVQSANDTNDATDRTNLDAEMTQLTTELDRIAVVAAWAGQSLLNGDGTDTALADQHTDTADFTFHVGSGTSAKDTIDIEIGATTAEALGLNGDAIRPDLQVTASPTSASGDIATATVTNSSHTLTVADAIDLSGGEFNDGDVYSVTINGEVVSITAADDDEYADSVAGLVEQFAAAINDADIAGVTAAADTTNGAVDITQAAHIENPEYGVADKWTFTLADTGSDDTYDKITIGTTLADETGSITMKINGVDATFDLTGALGFDLTDEDGVAAFIASEINANSADYGVTATAATGGVVQLQTALSVGNSSVSSSAASTAVYTASTGVLDFSDADTGDTFTFSIDGTSVTFDIAADGYSNAQEGVAAQAKAKIDDAGIQGLTVTDNGDGTLTLGKGGSIDISSADDAADAIDLLDNAIQTINSQRAELGSVSNRLDSTVSNLTNISANLQAGRGRIEDADFAAETTSLAKSQILQQASTAMLAQANASKQNVLSLLQG
jgi:flagellin